MGLKHIYLVKKDSHLYNVKNFLPHLMWDITNIPPCKYNVLIVSHGIVKSNRQTLLIESNPHTKVKTDFDIICNNSHLTI